MSAEATAERNDDFGRHLIDYGFAFFPTLIESARGATLVDVEGREILDFTSGQMCAILGHNHPEIVAAIDKARREPDPELGAAVTRRCMELGLSMNIVGVAGMAAIWRIAPPLTVTEPEIDRGLEIIDQALTELG